MKFVRVGLLLFLSLITTIAQASDSFQVNGDQTITDTKAYIMWQKSGSWLKSIFGVDGYEAMQTCGKLDVGGYSDWQLPDAGVFVELYSKKSSFPEKLSGVYWTSDYIGPNKYVVFNFDDGKKYSSLQSKGKFNVKCIRLIVNNSESTKSSHLADDRRYPLALYVAWAKYGFTPAEVSAWGKVTAGKATTTSHIGPQEAQTFKNFGFDPPEALECRARGVVPEVAKEWREQGIACREANEWRNLRQAPADAANWKAIQLSALEARQWIDKGFLPAEAQQWIGHNIDTFQASTWRENGLMADEAAKWIGASFSAFDARKWTDVGFSSDTAKSWRDKKFTPENASEWIKAGKTLDEAGKWVGFSPKTATKLAKMCPNGMNGLLDLVSANPYETAEKCYALQAASLQLLGRTQGLYTVYDKIFLIDFGNDPASPNYFSGYLVGKGAYKYVDITGAQRIVPSLKKINIQ